MKNWIVFDRSYKQPGILTRVKLSLLSVGMVENQRMLFALIVSLFLIHWDMMSWSAAIILIASTYLFNFFVSASFVREMVNVVNFIGGLYSTPHTPPKPPEPRYMIHKDLIEVGLNLHKHWREKDQRQRDMLYSRERVFDALTEPMLVVRQDWIVIAANAAAHAFFRQDMIGQKLDVVFPAPHVLDLIEEVFLTRKANEAAWQRPGDVPRFYQIGIFSIPAGEHTNDANVLVWIHNITALKKLEQMRADFVASASHELRTPLASLIGYTETLMGPAKNDPEAAARFLEIMLEQGQRMQRLIDDLLSLSQIEMKADSPPRDPVDLRAILDRVITGMDILVHKRRMTLKIDVTDALPPARGDGDQITGIFQNLLVNALKYGRQNTEVSVRIAVVENGPASMPQKLRSPCLHVEIANVGERISSKDLARLTERFYRLDMARSRRMGGNGLGLAIVKHSMLRHRGALTFDAPSGGGLTVGLYFPIFHEDSVAVPCPEAAEAL